MKRFSKMLLAMTMRRLPERVASANRLNIIAAYNPLPNIRRAAAASRQLRLLSQSTRLEETRAPGLVLGIALLSSATILSFIVWASFTNVNEIARTTGEIVPASFVKTVDHLDGGVVKAIAVQDGQIVEKNDILIKLDGAGFAEDLASAKAKQRGLELKGERLRAFVAEREPDYSRFGSVSDPDVADEQRIFEGMMRAIEQQRQVLDEGALQKQKAVTELEARLNASTKNFATVKILHQGRQTLFGKGLIPAARLAETEKELATLEGEVTATEAQVRQMEMAAVEFQSRIASLRSTAKDTKYQELHQVITEIAQNAEQIRKLVARMERLDVRAPSRGIIKGLKINTIGMVVQPGQVLLSLVPLNEELIVDTKIPPQHIGNIQVGQPVRINVSAFDSTRHGSILGHLTFISATTYADPNGTPYYAGKINLSQSYVGTNSKENAVMPGMTVMAEIVIGEKTVLDYLLKPIHSALSTAFSEK